MKICKTQLHRTSNPYHYREPPIYESIKLAQLSSTYSGTEIFFFFIFNQCKRDSLINGENRFREIKFINYLSASSLCQFPSMVMDTASDFSSPRILDIYREVLTELGINLFIITASISCLKIWYAGFHHAQNRVINHRLRKNTCAFMLRVFVTG